MNTNNLDNNKSIVSNTPFFSDVIFNKEIEQLIQGRYRYTSEFLYLNWEFHKLTLCKILNCDISNLPNPYEPTIIFMERGGGFTFSPPSHFNVGEIVIRKPKFEKIVNLPPFITFNEDSYKSADDEYIKDKAAFFEKYIRPVF